jgi:hypothetical protein
MGNLNLCDRVSHAIEKCALYHYQGTIVWMSPCRTYCDVAFDEPEDHLGEPPPPYGSKYRNISTYPIRLPVRLLRLASDKNDNLL